MPYLTEFADLQDELSVLEQGMDRLEAAVFAMEAGVGQADDAVEFRRISSDIAILRRATEKGAQLLGRLVNVGELIDSRLEQSTPWRDDLLTFDQAKAVVQQATEGMEKLI